MVGPTEDELERWVLEILTELGWSHVYGPDIAPGEPGAERRDYRDVVLTVRLTSAVAKLNPQLPPDAVADVVRTVLRAESPLVETENWNAYRYLIQGVPVDYRDEQGALRSDRAWLIDPYRRQIRSADAVRRPHFRRVGFHERG